MDWHGWHRAYEEGGRLRSRLRTVQAQLRSALIEASPGQVRIISICAGQGHDIVGAVSGSERRADVHGRLIELDGRNVQEARRRVGRARLTGIEVHHGDAGTTDAYVGATPADIVVLCGVFGSLTDDDVDAAIATLPSLCAERGQVIWTAHRAARGLFEYASAAFDRHGFITLWADPADPFGVARSQLAIESSVFQPGRRMFSFADERTLVELGRIT